MILVTGAAGQLGRLVIENLLKEMPANRIVAAVRNAGKASDLLERGIVVRQADYDHPEQWPLVMEGVEKVLLISGPDVGGRVRQHKTVIDAAAQAKSVRLIAYTSVLRAPVCAVPYASEDRETERMIDATGIASVFLRHGLYTENYTMNSTYAVKEGAFYGCAGNGQISGASRADYAAAAAAVLTASGAVQKTYELAGDTSFTLADLSAEIARQSGKPVAYVDLPEDRYRKLLVDYGLGEGLASTLALADSGAARGDFFSASGDLRRLTGRATTPLAALVGAALAGMP